MAMPKVFSLFGKRTYNEMFPNVMTLGDKVDFFLECSSYDVMIPIRSKVEKKLDIFEEAVLKLINFKSTSAKEMADILCLTEDLVNFILIRLQEMNLVEKNGMDLTSKGKEYINVENEKKDDTPTEYTHAKLFVLKKTGEILPYIHKGEFISENVEEFKGAFITLKCGTEGNFKKIKGKTLKQDRNDRKKSILQSDSIRKALSKFNRITSQMPQYNDFDFSYELAMDNTSSDDIYFHMQAVVQDGNIGEILISDGLVMNVDFIGQYIQRYYPDFILNVKERATRSVIQQSDDEDILEIKENKYKNESFRELEDLFKKINEVPALIDINNDEENLNQDQIQAQKAQQKQFLLDCYAAFEWCFYYYDLMNPLSSYMNDVIKNQSAYQNRKTIIQMAEKIGVSNTDRYSGLFSIFDDKKVSQMYKSKIPTLRIALSIAVLTAADDENSRFRTLCSIQPDILRILQSLSYEHGDLSHQTISHEVDKVRNKRVYELLVDSIRTLIPNFKFDDKDIADNSLDEASQERLNAEVSLSRELGSIYFYNILPNSIKDEWILVAPNRSKYPDTAEYFDILYRILQDTLYYSLKNIRVNSQLKKADILQKLKEKDIVSKSFNTVNNIYVSQILEDINSTLGANAMVYLAFQTDEMVENLEKLEFVSLVEKLVLLRKHGSNVALNTEVSELNRLRDKLLQVVKVIGGE